MSQAAAPGRPWEDDETGDQWKQPQRRMPQYQAHQEQQFRREDSASHQQTPQALLNRQTPNDHLQQPYHYGHRQQNATPCAQPALTRHSSEQLRESYCSTQSHHDYIRRTTGTAQRSTPHSYPVQENPKPWGQDQASNMSPPPYPPRSSTIFRQPSRDDSYQLHKRRKISDDEESHHSEDGDAERSHLESQPSDRMRNRPPVPSPASQYPHYPSTSIRVDHAQSRPMLPPLSTQGLVMRPSQPVAPQPSPPPPPPPPAPFASSNSMNNDHYRTQLYHTPNTAPQHNPGYPHPAAYRVSPKLSAPPQGHPPPPPPPLPPPPPPAPSSSNARDMSQQFNNYQPPTTYQRHYAPPVIPDIESQYFRLNQENQYLRDELCRATSEFIPGTNLRGIVAQLFEVVEDYADVVACQQQQVQDALDALESARACGNVNSTKGPRKDIPEPRRKAVLDRDLMTQDSVVACLRGMHTTMRSKLNTLKRVGDMKAKVGLMEKYAVGRSGAPLERREDDSLIRKVSWLEEERARLNGKLEALVRENEERQSREVPSRHLLPQTSDSCTPLRLPNSNSPNLSIPSSQAPSPNRQPPPHPSGSPSTVTIAPSTVPSSAIYNETLASLQHRLSVTQLELETLQSDHTRLRAALQRSQQRASTLGEKLNVSGEENEAIVTERDRYQMLYETLEEHLGEVAASRDEYRRQAVAGGGQYSAILANSTRLELMGVEDRRRWREEREGIEREKADLRRLVGEKERELERLKGEIKELREEVGRMREVDMRACSVDKGAAPSEPSPDGTALALVTERSAPKHDLELSNQALRNRVHNLEKTIREMRREGVEILRAAQRFMAAGEALE